MAIKRLSRGVVRRPTKVKGAAATIYISPSTPFAASLKTVDKRLNKARSTAALVAVIGMGRAIHTVVQIAAALRVRSYRVDLRTLTVKAADELVDEEKGTAEMVYRDVPAVELTVQFPKSF